MLWSYSLHCLNMFHIFLLPFIVYHCHPIHSIPGPLQCNSYIADPGKHSSKQVSERVCFQISRVVLLRTCFQFLRREGWKPHITVHSFISLMISRGVAWYEPQSLYVWYWGKGMIGKSPVINTFCSTFPVLIWLPFKILNCLNRLLEHIHTR